MTETRHAILRLRLADERHVVHARQHARDIAALLGFDRLEQVRLATATSELARNAFRYAREGTVEFFLAEGERLRLEIEVQDRGPGIAELETILGGRYRSSSGMGRGLIGTQRLMDHFQIRTSGSGTCVLVGKHLPGSQHADGGQLVRSLQAELGRTGVDPFGEIERQNQDLLRTLAELREQQEQLAEVNRELEDTNRGVVALYGELEQNATDLRRVSDLKTSFLSNLSHEFRTPLNAILALCQILINRADGDLTLEQERQIGYIRKSAADLSELVNDLLDVAKVEAGKVEVKSAPFSVTELFGALRGMLRTLLTSNSVELIFTAPEDLPLLETDERKVSQILRNLIANALKFTERGHVHISAELLGEHIVFRVADTGIGIAQEDQERVFEEFVQIGGAIQSRVRGTGLGLPLARRLAEVLGGTLTLESAVGLGSTFTVVLPAHISSMEQVEPPSAMQISTGKPDVLIVEDVPETRFIHRVTLKSTPFVVRFARNLAEARVLIAEMPPQVLLLDRMLDGVDSLHFIAELRGSGFRGGVVVASVVDDPEGASAAGADAFLVKPIAPGLLADKLGELLGANARKPLLLVDDDEIHRYVLREALQPFRFKLLEARSGREALTVAAGTPLAAIFLDLSMPGLTGLETLRELKAAAATAALPIIIHTSKELTEQERDTIERLGASIFPKRSLNDPQAPETLRDLLTHLRIL